MKIKNLQMKKAFRTVLFVLLLCAAGMTKAQTENITFADANVKAICVANWDTDGDGELNQAEAAAVTSLDGVFMFDDGITSFDELQFFTGLTSIGEDEFNSCTSLTAVSIPNEVTSIGNYAFSDCSSLTSLTSYACTSPTMGNNVFDNVPSAMVINVPCHTSAMYQAAEGWSDFSNYVEFEYGLCPIPFVDDNVKAICVAHWDTNGDGELSYAEAAAVTNLGTYFKSTAITSFDELEYFTSLTSIPNTAFYGCTSLASITLPSSVSTLGNGSFYNCTNLATMTVYAETPPTVGTNAFKNVPTDIVVYLPCGTYDAYHNANGWSQFANMQEPGSCPIVFADANVKALCVANWDTNGDGELSYTEAAAVTDLGGVFENKSNITSFDELQYFIGLTSLGSNAFSNGWSLTSIIIPNSVTSIGYATFWYCSSLTAIDIPNSVTSIGGSAFSGCSGLTSIEIPNSVTYIGGSSFRGCSGLEQIIVDSGNTMYDSRNNCNAIINSSTNELIAGCKNTVIPNSVTFIGVYSFSGSTGLISIEIPISVTSIGSGAFSECMNLTSVEIPNSVTYIGTNPFSNCNNLAQIIVDSDNMVYDSREGCNAIIKTSTNELVSGCKNTIIPNSVTSIGSNSFYGCTGLITIDIPNSVTLIGYGAFEYCYGLTSLTIGNSVTSIGSYAFYGCRGLTSIIVLADNTPTLGVNAFYNTGIPVYVPCESIETYASANWGGFSNFIGLCAGEITTISNPFDGGTVMGGGYYEGGATCALTAMANEGYCFYYWTENGVEVSSTATYSFIVTGDRDLVANFGAPLNVTVAVSPEEGGTVSGGGEYGYNQACTLTAMANEGYMFDHWTQDGEVVSYLSTYSFTVTENIDIVAEFLPLSGTLVGEADDANVYLPSYSYYKYSLSQQIYTPDEIGEVGIITNISYFNTGGTKTRYYDIYMVHTDKTAFESNTDWIAVSESNRVFSGNVTMTQGYWNTIILDTPFVYNGTSNLAIIIDDNSWNWTNSPHMACRVFNAEDNQAIFIYNDNTNYTPYNPSGYNGTLCSEKNQIIFNRQQCIVNVESNDLSMGSAIGSGWYAIGDICTLTATANEGYCFYYWTENGTVVSSEATYSFLVTRDRNLVANFGAPINVMVTASPEEGGIVSGGGEYGYNQTCILTATANEGYTFINWTKEGEVISCYEMYSFVVTENVSLVANFILTPPAPVVTEYYPDPDEPNSPYVKVHWAEVPSDVIIGDEISSIYTAYMPFYTLYNSSLSEALYTADELAAAGLTTAPMTSLSWEAIDVTTTQTQNNISIWMANVSDTELTTTSHLASNMTLVYTGNIGIPPLGWNEFVFNEGSFAWDGTSNVLILVQRNNGQWSGHVYWRSHNPGFYGMAYKYQDNPPFDATTQTYTLNRSNTARPNIVIKAGGMNTYNLYRANCDDTGAQMIAENLSETQYIDETWEQLVNGSYKYGISVANSTNTEIFWSNCIENNFIPTAFHFITPGNWSNAANWQYGALPGVYDIVFIDANCQLDMTTEVAELTVSNGQSLTLQPDKTLTVTGNLTNTSTEGLVIKDGAQLINATGNVAATMEKDIVAYGNDNPDAWYTIASPMDEMPIEGSSFAIPEFDLYRFNENNLTNEEWENYKGGLADFTTFENGRGYLFANSNAFSPAFTGTLNASSVTYPLSYTERPNDPLSGFHFIGNPFSHDIYKGAGAAIDDANLASGYYTLTNEGTWQVHTFEDAIHPGQGILVKATAPTVLMIAKSTAVATAETGEAKRETSPLSISVKGENGQDQAFVYFGRGNSMEKMGGFVAQEPSLWVRDNGKDYAIAHVEKADETLELCFSSKQVGDFTLTVDRNETEFEYLQLVDHITGLTVDLLKQPTYGFQAAGQEPEARFSIRFKVVE
jgi:hypothetical protein